MFDNLLRELKKYEGGKQIAIDTPTDEDGYFDRKCPSSLCKIDFKIFMQDWKEKVSQDKAFCPACRYEAEATNWNTPEQSEYIRQSAIAHLKSVTHQALQKDARAFNSRPQRGFIKLSLSIKNTPSPTILPIDAEKAMRQKFECKKCGCRYAAVGLAYFCPACGNNSVVESFTNTVNVARDLVTLIPEIHRKLSKEFDDDLAKNSVQNSREDSIGRLVAAFQRYSEALFNNLRNANQFNYPKNVFQNLKEASDLWRKATNHGYDDFLAANELKELNVLFQKRHLFAHKSGIVDQDYINKSGDTTYQIGQRIVISDAEIIRLADLITKLGSELAKI